LGKGQKLQVIDGRFVKILVKFLGHFRLAVIELAEAGGADETEELCIHFVDGPQ
jgi:hypothetical protein